MRALLFCFLLLLSGCNASMGAGLLQGFNDGMAVNRAQDPALAEYIRQQQLNRQQQERMHQEMMNELFRQQQEDRIHQLFGY